jgi:hypothetical protein
MLGNLYSDISKALGGSLTDEVSRMLEIFTANSESIEKNFTSLHQRIEDLEQNVITAIKEEKKNAIDSLKEDIKSLAE